MGSTPTATEGVEPVSGRDFASAPKPVNETQRLTDLHVLGLLDTEGDPFLDAMTRIVAALFSVPVALVSLVGEDDQWFVARTGLDARSTPRQVSFCAHALLGDDVFVVPDASADDRFARNPLVTGPPHVGFYAGAPVQSPSGSRLGTICAIDHSAREFTAEDRARLADCAAVIQEAIFHRAASVTDPVTGLYDRGGFDRALRHAVALAERGSTTVTVAYADIDDLKGINDRHGHAAGDAAILAVADALRNEFRAADIVARLGGDEFAVLMFDSTDAASALSRVERSLGSIHLSVAAVDHELGEPADALIDRADQAMYAVKRTRSHRHSA